MADKRASKSQSAGNTPPRHHAHPLARWAWEVLRDRSEADKHLVFAALRQRLDPGPSNGKAQQALEALNRSRELLGLDSAPSRGQYDEFRAKQSQPKEWPSATLIRNALGEGSWQRAAAIADGKPLSDVTARRLISNGKAFTRKQLEPILRHWAERTEGALPMSDFLAWCRDEAQSKNPAFERLPLSANTIERRFGGWAEALLAIGELDRCRWWQGQIEKASGKPRGGKRPKKRFDLSALPQGDGAQHSPESLKAWLRWAAAEFETSQEKPMRCSDYTAIREQLLREARAEKRIVRMPSVETMRARLGSFRAAQIELGLLSAKHALWSRRKYRDKELRGAVLKAAAATGASVEGGLAGDLSLTGYMKWRSRELTRRRGPRQARIPGRTAIIERLGGGKREWAEVLHRVRAGHSDSPEEDGNNGHRGKGRRRNR